MFDQLFRVAVDPVYHFLLDADIQVDLDRLVGRRHLNAAAEAADKIVAIREKINQVVAKIGDIALSTKEQHSATTSMAQAAEKITNQTQHSDSALQRAAQEVRQLNESASKLHDLFSNFRI